MFCSKCGTETPDDSEFCRKCGKALGVVSTGGGAAAAMAPARIAEPEPKRSSRSSRIPLFLLIVLVMGLAGVWLHNSSTHTAPLPIAQSQPPQPQLHTQTTGDKAFTVNAIGSYYFTFEVPASAYNVNLKGHFSATGGTGNDINVVLLTDDDRVNWQNGHEIHALYNSGKVTQDTVNVMLPADAGKYCLVFNNKFSLLTPKAVQANVALTYYTR